MDRGESRYAHPEREQRWLLDAVPRGATGTAEIYDRYIVGTRLRLRRITRAGAEEYKLAQKVRADVSDPQTVSLTNMYLDVREYERLAQLPARAIRKTRWHLEHAGRRIAVDQFHDDLVGLVLAEVELEPDEPHLPVPPFARQDVSKDDRYSGGGLAFAAVAEVDRTIDQRAQRIPANDERVEALVAHYTASDEAPRLVRKEGLVEFTRTQEILRAHLPSRSTVLDVGGAHGVHARWLAEDGHVVNIVDLVPHHVEQARAQGLRATVGDARQLPNDDASVDAVLLLGPLYHLPEDEDREQALAEANRVLRPGGLLAVAAISRLAVVLDFHRRGRLREPAAIDMVRRIVANGSDDTGFGSGVFYFHTVDQLRTEVERVSFVEVAVHGLEGPAWPTIKPGDHDPELIDAVATIATLADAEPAAAGASTHLLVLARKPES